MTADMTIGQRIAQKRKELGLSQEDLGGRLGVSRQAIYKWEADQTMPEIDKLVTLSKLFSVTVGWLLGVEEDAAPAEDSGELTEAQLRMVREIVDRYIAALPREAPAPPEDGEEATAPRKKRRWPFVLAGAVLIVVFVQLFSQLNHLRDQYDRLNSSLSSVQSTVSNQLNMMASRVESILESQNSLLAKRSAQLLGKDLAAGTVSFDLYAMPKTYEAGMTAVFVAESGGETVEVPAEPGADHAFSAQITCPLTDDITLSVALLTADGRRQTQLLEQYTYLLGETFPTAWIEFGLWVHRLEDDTVPADAVRYDIDVSGDSADAEVARVERVRMGLFRDRELVMWYEPSTREIILNGKPAEEEVFLRPEVTLDRGHVYCEAIVLTDEYGRERVYQDVWIEYRNGEWTNADGGEWKSDPADWVY